MVLPHQKTRHLPGFLGLGSLLVLGLLAGEAADREAAVAVGVVGRSDVARAEVEAVGAASIRVRSRRPTITLVACVPQRPRVDVPAGIEVQRSLSNSRATSSITTNAIGAHQGLEGAAIRIIGGRKLPAFGADTIGCFLTGNRATGTSRRGVPLVKITD